MVDNKIIYIDGIGLVKFQRSRRAKCISITVKPFRGVRVAVPPRSSFRKAEEFAYAKRIWISRQIEKIKYYEKRYQDNMSKAEKIDRDEAKTILTTRLKNLAKNSGFSYKKIFIRNQKTRWGSCSSKNNISLNMKLTMLPDELVDYVILHELVHTRKKDHSKAFWAEMDKLVGNSKRLRLELRHYGIELY
jgi:predicted metal-dependent hydrolase